MEITFPYKLWQFDSLAVIDNISYRRPNMSAFLNSLKIITMSCNSFGKMRKGASDFGYANYIILYCFKIISC